MRWPCNSCRLDPVNTSPTFALVELYHIAVKKMVLQPIVLPVSVDQQNVLLILASIVPNLLHVVRVVMD